MDNKEIEARMMPKYEHDREFEMYVSDLLDFGKLEGVVVIGIAKQIVARGVSSLTPMQRKTFINYGLRKGNYVDACEGCAESIPWSEMLFALDDGLCSYCRYKLEKDD
jgi:hypothetical protein